MDMKKGVLVLLVLVASLSFIFVFSFYGNRGGTGLAPITGEAVTDNLRNLWRAIINPLGCSVLGDRQCHVSRENYYQVCEGKKTLSWRTYSCDRGLICSDGYCVCSSENSCDFAGERSCYSNGRISVCEADENGCLKWSRGARCGGRESCVNGECVLIHCSDGILNFGEEDLDCGGGDCPACPCVEDWSCGGWSDCVDYIQTRTCTDSNNCGSEEGKPEETQNCCIETCSNLEYECGLQTVCGIDVSCGICVEGYDCELGTCVQNVTIPPEESPPVLSINQYLVNASEVISINTNQGDIIEVTYNQNWKGSAVITVKSVSTPESTRLRESHTVSIEEITLTKVRVTVV